MRRIAIEHRPLDRPAGKGLRRRYRVMVRAKANPRDPGYMRELLAERRPDAELVGSEDPEFAQRLSAADEIILLYPDATGLRFGHLEHEVRRRSRAGVPLTALSGRRRELRLDRRTHRALLIRRFAERALLGEALMTATVLLAVGPLLVWDTMRGHR